MSMWSRIANVFRGDRLSREIDEELQSHIAEAIEQGRDPAEARKSFGGALQMREECRDFRLFAWLESLRADTVFAWRQFLKHKVTTAAAVLSLALAIGACTSAFRLIDAIRQSVRFTKVNASNVSEMRGFTGIDVIFCRNMLIYFDDRSRRQVVESFYDSLSQGGFICLGHSESMSRISSLFEVRKFPQAIVYQKRGGPR